jgi:methyl-accepting chemotaxis protein
MTPTELTNSDSQQLLFLPASQSEPDAATRKILEIEQLLIDALTAFQGLRESFIGQARTELALTTTRELADNQQQQIQDLETRLAEERDRSVLQQNLYIERSNHFQQLFQNFETIVGSLKSQIDKLQSGEQNYSTTAIVDRQLALVTQADRQIADIHRHFADNINSIELSLDFKQLPAELSTLNTNLEGVAREIDRHSIQVRGFANRTTLSQRNNPTANLEIKPYGDRSCVPLAIDLPRF